MRRKEYQMDAASAWALLAGAPWVRVATTTPDGAPVLRSLHAVIYGGRLCFHGAPAGEKTLAVGQRAVIGWEEVIAEVPSYWTDPERACPATTLFLSAQAHGVLESVEDRDDRAAILQGLMSRYQPEGGHAPITATDPRYAPALKNLLIMAMRPTQLDGKAKLAQNRKPEQVTALAERLWERGAPGDPRAVELVLAANPDAARPAFLQGPDGVTLLAHLAPPQRDAAVDMLADTYWCAGLPRQTLRDAFDRSSAVIGACFDGRLIACARGVSDHTRRAWIYDVFVDPAWRGAGVGAALMRLLLEHPALRHAYHVRLGTRDAAPFYRGFGFVPITERPTPAPVTEMILTRATGAGR